MNYRHFLHLISLCILTTLPFHRSMAKEGDSFLDALLRFTGIASTPNQTRGSNNFMEGDIWLIHVGDDQASESRKITHSGTYRTPLWIPGSQLILAMKGNKLVRLNAQGNQETELHTLTNNTTLLGFDKNNPALVLILQDPIVGILSLANGKITHLPYDQKKIEEREGLDRLRNDARKYASAEVSIEDKKELASQGGFKSLSTIHITQGNKVIHPILCPAACSQPALTEDGRQLLFISH